MVSMTTLKPLADAMSKSVRDERKLLDERVTLIAKARLAGMNWIQIAECLGLGTRQSALRRYEKLSDQRMVALLEKL